jgi:zinc protease
MKKVAPFVFLLAIQVSQAADYCVVVSKETAAEEDWAKVVSVLQKKHSATILSYEKSVEESLPSLRKSFPKYACFVARPQETTKEFVKTIHRLTRQLDEDPYTDLFWGILTGHDAGNALAIAKTSEPLVIRNSLACTEIALDRCERGKWFCELRKGHGVTKEKGKASNAIRLPQDTTSLFVKELNQGKPDLFVTSGHATEHDLQLGFRYRNGVFRCKDGTLFGSDLSGKRHLVKSPNPKVYMPIGNCLMGHLDGPDSMAAAFLESAGVHQMMGYVEVTWYGYMGWGCLDYFIEQPGRYTFTEAFFANHHGLIHRLETCFPEIARLPSGKGARSRPGAGLSPEARKLGLGTQDARGLLFDRDIVAFYGDPAWQAKMANGKLNWEQALTRRGDEYRFTITPQLGPNSYAPVNENGVQRGHRPFVAFFDNHLGKATVVSGGELNPLITDNFILIPNPPSKQPAKPLEVVFRAKQLNRSD